MLPIFPFIFLQVAAASPVTRTLLPFLPTQEGMNLNDLVSRSLGLADSSGVRRPRNIVSILSLLWPQVVGPIDNGVIKEDGFDEVAKTPIETQLDVIRERSRAEAATRQHVRDLLNHGTPPGQIGFQLYSLHQDMNLFPHPFPPVDHPLLPPLDHSLLHPADHPVLHPVVLPLLHPAPNLLLHPVIPLDPSTSIIHVAPNFHQGDFVPHIDMAAVPSKLHHVDGHPWMHLIKGPPGGQTAGVPINEHVDAHPWMQIIQGAPSGPEPTHFSIK